MILLSAILLRRGGDEAMVMTILFCELFFFLIFGGVMIASHWKVLEKAGQEGWKCLIPFYGTYVMVTEVAGKDTNHFILHLIPIVNIYATVVTYMAIAKSFGKDDGFGIGMFFLGIIFWPMLAFGKNNLYIGPGGVPKQPTVDNSITPNWQSPNNPANN